MYFSSSGVDAELAELVPAGVQEEQVALLHLDTVFDHLRRVEAELVHRVREIDERARTAEPLDRDLVDRHPGGHEVTGRIEMRAHVVRRHDVLRVDAVLGLALDVLHLERRVIRPEAALFVERLRQIVDLSCRAPPIGRHARARAWSEPPPAGGDSRLEAWMSLVGSMSCAAAASAAARMRSAVGAWPTSCCATCAETHRPIGDAQQRDARAGCRGPAHRRRRGPPRRRERSRHGGAKPRRTQSRCAARA